MRNRDIRRKRWKPLFEKQGEGEGWKPLFEKQGDNERYIYIHDEGDGNRCMRE